MSATGAAPARGPWSGRRLHLIGVAGAGMSGYARAAFQLGASVTGSDRSDSAFARALVGDGVLEPVIGHAPENIPAGDDVEVVYSSAIPEDNVERAAAQARGLRVIARAGLLAELSALRRTIAVAGAHGKTTTASMIVVALRGAGLDPGYLIGGTLRDTGRGSDWGSGEWLVVEADESDRSLLELSVEIAVLGNVELDHHDHFGSLYELEQVYREFLSHAPQAVIWNRPELLALRGSAAVLSYDVAEPELLPGGSRFDFDGVTVELAVPGAHNARNAAAALSVARLAGADPAAAAVALGGFSGAGRRFERLGASRSGAQIYDDYAHHPTEIAATLAAARTLAPRRLMAVFQPHLYSRTRALAREFGEALASADLVAVLDIYPAREQAGDFPGVSGLLVAEATVDAVPGKQTYWLPDRGDALKVLSGLLEEGDLMVVMGAGDVDAVGRALVGHDDG